MSGIRLNDQFFPPDLQQDARSIWLPAAQGALKALVGKSCVGAEWTGWFDWPRQRGFALQREVEAFVRDLDVGYDLVVVVGIGGSYLGARAVLEALGHGHASLLGGVPGRPPVVYAGHNLSEQGLVELLELLDKRRPVLNVISKSGTTTEPAVAFRILRAYMERRFGKAEAAKRIVATTDAKKGALRRLATEAGYRCFVVPDDVGGRYSVLTAVGLVPLALAGLATDKLLDGADQVFRALQAPDGGEHAAVRYAAARMAAYKTGKRIELLSFSEPKLAYVVEWWKQLFGESEGKSGKGLFPAGLNYTTDLHSLGQYVQEGPRNMLETFLIDGRSDAPVEKRLRVPRAGDNLDELGYLEERYIGEINEAAMLGTMVAHADGGVPCLALQLPELSERGLGQLFAFFETACAVGAAMLDVNPFDQPGVEAYKKNLFGLLGKPGFESLGAELRRRL